MIEVWSPIKGYEGYYEVSNLGRVKSISRPARITLRNGTPSVRRHIGRILKGCPDQDGYYGVYLSKIKARRVKIAKLVALHFVDNPNNFPVVNHLDGIKTNDIFTNLEWCTFEQNREHAIRTGLINMKGENNVSVKLKIDDILYIRKSGKNAKIISKEFNICEEHARKIIKGRVWKSVK